MLRLRSMTVSSKTGNYSSVSKGGATVTYLRVYLYLRIFLKLNERYRIAIRTIKRARIVFYSWKLKEQR